VTTTKLKKKKKEEKLQNNLKYYLSQTYFLTTGEEQHVVGRVSMDAITVRVRDDTTLNTPFYVYSDNPEAVNSITNMARQLDTIAYEIGTSLLKRTPRLYLTASWVHTADGKTAPLPCFEFDSCVDNEVNGISDKVDSTSQRPS
jgi:hypothetical protein